MTTLTKPKRPLSGYNLFFKDQRQMIKTEIAAGNGDDGTSMFSNLARIVGARWNALDGESKKPYEERARVEKIAYRKGVIAWKKQQRLSKKKIAAQHKRSSGALQQTGPRNVPLVPQEMAPPKTEADVSKSLMDQVSLDGMMEQSWLSSSTTDPIPLSASACANLTQGLDLLANRLEENDVDWLVGLFQENSTDTQVPSAVFTDTDSHSSTALYSNGADPSLFEF
mmetsp:Transcript_2623/g.5497  ORF Transcript_2623/g.5497 Transcript_2623/m.5497 type:complete len:225 (+) Transcript_2623:4578-5252(+)